MASLTSSQIVSGNPIHPSKILGPVEPTVKRELNISPQNVRFSTKFQNQARVSAHNFVYCYMIFTLFFTLFFKRTLKFKEKSENFWLKALECS